MQARRHGKVRAADASAKGAKQMNRLNRSRCARRSVYVAVMLLAGCGGSQLQIGVPGAKSQTSTVVPTRTIVPALSYRVLYRFAGDLGNGPAAALIDVGGKLYGTTQGGGEYGSGSFYSISTAGVEKVLYSFAGSSDRGESGSKLNRHQGHFVQHDHVWWLAMLLQPWLRDHIPRKYHRLRESAAPFQPFRPALSWRVSLFGFARCERHSLRHDLRRRRLGCPQNGHRGCGTVYSVSTTGSQTVLHRFGRGADGAVPSGNLINVNGTLYGTTLEGGSFGYRGGSFGYGTVYSITRTGTEKVLHSFAGGTDGLQPWAGLVNEKGLLYGTTYAGGSRRNGGNGYRGQFTS